LPPSARDCDTGCTRAPALQPLTSRLQRSKNMNIASQMLGNIGSSHGILCCALEAAFAGWSNAACTIDLHLVTSCLQVLLLAAQRNGIRTVSRTQSLGSARVFLYPRCGSAVFSPSIVQRQKIPVVVFQRHFGFFDILKQKLKEELEKNEDFRNKVKTAQETEGMKKAADAAAATKVENEQIEFALQTHNVSSHLFSGHCRISCSFRCCSCRESRVQGWRSCISC
jgi:hypothetical protein